MERKYLLALRAVLKGELESMLENCQFASKQQYQKVEL